MVLSVFRISALIMGMICGILGLALPVQGVEPVGAEIVLREDGLLLNAINSLWAGAGAFLCLVVVFVIVWKERES